MQRKLDHYFKVQTNTHKTDSCFVYDPDNTTAFFTNKPDATDKFIDTASGIKLYYRNSIKQHSYSNIPQVTTNLTIPLLKSNLQKAVRRQQHSIALTTTIALLQLDPTELLRRLPIIYIEDVCLTDSFCIIIWLMMSPRQSYKLTNQDVYIILAIVNDLCNQNNYYDLNYTTDIKFTLRELQEFQQKDYLIGLYYRALYGGMKSDIVMLNNAIHYYSTHADEIYHTNYAALDVSIIEPYVQMIDAAIDFHPLPNMLKYINSKLDVREEDIKKTIWFAESGVNIRKQDTLDASNNYCQTELWLKLRPILQQFRQNIMRQYIK